MSDSDLTCKHGKYVCADCGYRPALDGSPARLTDLRRYDEMLYQSGSFLVNPREQWEMAYRIDHPAKPY